MNIILSGAALVLFAAPVAETFDGWPRETMTLDPNERNRRLKQWTTAPAARGAPRARNICCP